MSGAASDFLENKLLDHTLRNTAYPQPTGLFVALFTASTGLEANNPSAEISTSGTGYGRKAATFGAASGGSANTSATITFDVATANQGTITHVAVMDAVSGGNVLFHGAVTGAGKTIETGDTFQIAGGNLTITLD